MPSARPSSDAIARVSPTTAHLGHAVDRPVGHSAERGARRHVDEPARPVAAIARHVGRLTLSAPRICVSITVSVRSSGNFANGAMRTWPALFTTTSMRPYASSAVCTIAGPPPVWQRSRSSRPLRHRRRRSRGPRRRPGWTVGTSPAPSVSLMATPKSFTTTRAPRDASRSAYSRPRLRPDPVTTATLPSKRSSAIGINRYSPWALLITSGLEYSRHSTTFPSWNFTIMM